MGLTKTVQSAILNPSIKLQIDRGAVFISTPVVRNGFPTGGKGKSPKLIQLPGPVSWDVGENPPDCHIYVECYRGFQNKHAYVFCISMDRFHAVHFLSPPDASSGINVREVNIMKKILTMILALAMVLAMTACGGNSAAPADQGAAAVITGVEDGVLTVGMECAYAPYNWTQMDDSNGAVPIANNPGSYANGYDVMIAKKICEANGWELEVMAIGWDGLVPALNAGQLDAVIAGQSMTEERLAEVDMYIDYQLISIFYHPFLLIFSIF